MHLCAQCMAKKNKVLDIVNIQGLLSSLFLSANDKETQPKQSKLTCSRCGMDYENFRKTGMLGCSQCYHDFMTQLAPILMRIHGRVQHAGHVPPEVSRENNEKHEVERMKKEMEAAVAEENFELAAQLRDAIRAIQNSQEDKKQARDVKEGAQNA